MDIVTGGVKRFTLTVCEDGKKEVVYDVTVTVLGLQSQFFEDFEGGSIPADWKSISLGTGGWMVIDSNQPQGGNGKSVLHSDYSGVNNSWLIMPATVIGDDSLLSFWQKGVFDSFYDYHGIWVSESSDDPSSGDFVQLTEIGACTNVWTEYTVDLSTYAGKTIYLAFVYQGNFADRWLIDDVSLR